MSNIFSSIRGTKLKRNAFNLGHEVKLSCNMGDLVPILCQEVVPGDKFKLKTEMMLRFAPMLAPIMHRVNVYTHFFFVPNRLTFDGWEDFITGGRDGTAGMAFPYIELTDSQLGENLYNGSLADYMGIPIPNYDGTPNYAKFSALPFRAYQMIFNEYYRDQNLSLPIEFDTLPGKVIDEQVGDLLALRKRAWEKDYFTSALPWAQRGQPVNIPLGDRAPIYYEQGTNKRNIVRDAINGSPLGTTSSGKLLTDDEGYLAVTDTEVQRSGNIDPNGTLFTDLTSATATTVNDLRNSIRLQEWLEKNARGGARYIEQILSHFGVRSSDARLQRPEYLGGGKSPVVVSEVLQTSASDTTSPQANPAGIAYSTGNTHEFSRYFEEHGFVIGIMSVLPRTAYQQGLPRVFQKFDRFDYFWPEFQHLGEQEIKQRELYYMFSNTSESTNDNTFGYTPRYAEYKYINSSVHGDFRNTLAFWHLGRIFNTNPALNESFVTADPSNRIFAVEEAGNQKLWIQLYHDLKAIRPMAKYGTPTL